MRSSIALVILLTLVGEATANNIDLSTVPSRDTVSLTIYNGEDLTLVRETRRVTFKKGVNPLQFSWASTLIDPSSVRLKFITQAEKLDVLDTTFPHDKPQMLYWNVQSDFAGEAMIEITYFTSGISWKADYIAIANKDETQVNLEGFVRVFNNSGEEYENAQVRLVVGSINLVEKIAELAHIPLSEVVNMPGPERGSMRKWAFTTYAADNLSSVTRAGGGGGAGAGPAARPKEIIKEGLSEYFIYTIEGTETITNGWSKRLRSLEASSVPFKVQYRYRPQEYGEQLVRMYLLANDVKSKLGTTPLPDGIVRVFRDNGREGLSFLVAQPTKYIPIGDKIELNLGADSEVIFDLIHLRTVRDNIWMQINGANVFRQVDGGGKIEVNSSVAGWDDRSVFAQRIRNYTTRPIEVEVRRSFDGHVLFRSALQPVQHDFRTVQFTATVEAGKRADLRYELVTHCGRNSQQNNVTIEKAEVVP